MVILDSNLMRLTLRKGEPLMLKVLKVTERDPSPTLLAIDTKCFKATFYSSSQVIISVNRKLS